ncbi:hypothetical protein M6B38_368080 [Iris pallida]|uniref:Uncharacterized protein n=1 Tax=Iris pallida TaxID=29817 RepID=A0AAX6GET7_IRIPA|nr:hypothetical protein M6B38_368080 [Iris pallida]
MRCLPLPRADPAIRRQLDGFSSFRRGRDFDGGSDQLRSAGDGDVPSWLRDLQIWTRSGKVRLWTSKQRQPRRLVLDGEGSASLAVRLRHGEYGLTTQRWSSFSGGSSYFGKHHSVRKSMAAQGGVRSKSGLPSPDQVELRRWLLARRRGTAQRVVAMTSSLASRMLGAGEDERTGGAP